MTDRNYVKVRGRVKIADTGNHIDMWFYARVIKELPDYTEIFVPDLDAFFLVSNWHIQ